MRMDILTALLVFVVVKVFAVVAKERTSIVKEHGTVTISLSKNEEFIKYVTFDGKVVVIGGKTINTTENIEVLNSSNTSVTFTITNIRTNQAGEYCLNNKTDNCHLLIVTSAPNVTLTSNRTSVSCTAEKSDNNNLTMMYRWFLDGQVYPTHNLSVLFLNSTSRQSEITCIATDDPGCQDFLRNSSLSLESVLKEEKCNGVYGMAKYKDTKSSSIALISTTSYDTKSSSVALISTTSYDVAEVTSSDVDTEELQKLVFISISIALVLVAIPLFLLFIKVFHRPRLPYTNSAVYTGRVADMIHDPRINVSAAFMNHFYTRYSSLMKQLRDVEGLTYADLALRDSGMSRVRPNKSLSRDTISEFDFSKIASPRPSLTSYSRK